ncbi:Ldh family oxidoreductase [Nocardia sp. R6R-6]|uniref:Ldh family oxidoreductase n=1 Tax=Nocardia sp. R6R-6 TaxID=3459303 RepID=UPI00403E3633
MPYLRPDDLKLLVTRIFEAADTPSDLAEDVAEILIDNHLAGHDSHGVLRVDLYLKWIELGRIVPRARPEIVHRTTTTALIRGHRGFGHPAALLATDLATSMALENGTAAVGVVEIGHTGRLAAFTDRAARKGVAMFMTVGNGGPSMTVPFGGAQASLGTNPISFSVPREPNDPISLDFATSAIANGKVMLARAEGKQVPENCIVRQDGTPTTDPNDYFEGGHLLPFGGHKGYALAVVADMLAGPLTGADQYPGAAMETGLFIFAVSDSAFRPHGDYSCAANDLAARITRVPPAPGFAEVLLPGDPEARVRTERQATGIPVAETTWQELKKIAAQLDLDADEIAGLS